MFDLHRHDEYSTFDGFGKAKELAELASSYGYKSLSTTNHGNTNGLIQTYIACKELDMKAILGVEGYFLPKYKPQTRGYHLILIAKNLKGYGNLNRLQYEGEKQKYYNPIWTFDMLEEYHEGLICSSACVAGYLAQCIINEKYEQAEKFLIKMKSIFKDDFYVEIQPYKISDKGVQEKVNKEAWKLANKLGIKCILTSDSHRGREDELDTYIKMHEVAGHDISHISETYAERYMPLPDEMQKRFYKMHKDDFETKDDCKAFIKDMVKNLDEIENKCEKNYLDKLPLRLPKLGENSKKKLIEDIKKGLKDRGKLEKKYIDRCKEELEVISYHGFEDYFLIVADYVNWAKSQGIVVGPGRGSVCNSLVAYALKITEVDSLLFNLDFRRFLRKDKAKYPDIDLDFETSRRHEVIEYLCEKYKGHAARICSYGLYRVDNLLNDLAKVSGLITDKTVDSEQAKSNKAEIAKIKSFINSCIDNDVIDKERLLNSSEGIEINNMYDNILVNFTKLYKKVKYIGTHAAGVAITGGELLDYVAFKVDKDFNIFTNYDLSDIHEVNVIKFDILGLKTMESIGDLRKSTGVEVNYDEACNDNKIIENFGKGNCDGIFQFEKKTARDILEKISCNCFDDVVAASSMNRPGPLSLKMPEAYAEGKVNVEELKSSGYYEYAKESYGTIIYQEQIMLIGVNIGGLSWNEADKLVHIKELGDDKQEIIDKFVEGAIKKGFDEDDARDLLEKLLTYSFNKGHAVGYTLISVEEMFYKVYYPNEYWFSKLKYAKDEAEYQKFCSKAVVDGSVIFLPHVNYSVEKTKIRKVENENCLQQGLSEIKDVGEKAAAYIVEERNRNGIFRSYDDFYDRCKSRTVTSRVINKLLEQGALEFKKDVYLKRVTKYNSALYQRGMS